jgi:hypothetical protein
MNKFICLIFFCSLTGCSNKDKIPSSIISKNEMQNILWDMIQADQYAKQFIVKDSAKRNVSAETMKLYDEIFQIHHITQQEFQKSYQFYMGRPDLLKIIFDSLALQGNRHMQEIYKPVSPPVKPK